MARTEFDFIKLTFHVRLMNKVEMKIMMQLVRAKQGSVTQEGKTEGQGVDGGEGESKRVAYTKTKDVKSKNAARCCHILLLATRHDAPRCDCGCGAGLVFA